MADAPSASQRIRATLNRADFTGLVGIVGAPGSGRSSTLRDATAELRGPVFTGGGLATLRHVPGIAVARAIRARLPERDLALAVEAVRARIGTGLLVVDDVQWADALTLSILPRLAGHCRVLIAVRTPSGLPPAVEAALRSAATDWVRVTPLAADAARDLVRHTAPALDPAAVDAVLAQAAGSPLALRVLALRAATVGNPDGSLEHAIATAIAALPRNARTAVAALGLLGRPVPESLLGDGAAILRAEGWLVDAADGRVAASPPYFAEVAAAALPAGERVPLHRRIAGLVGDAEAARHFALAGAPDDAYTAAVRAARTAGTVGERAAALLTAAGLDTPRVTRAVRLEAAEAALAAGRASRCLQVLDALEPPAGPSVAVVAAAEGPASGAVRGRAAVSGVSPGERVRAAVLRAEAHLQLGAARSAASAAADVTLLIADVPPALAAEHARVGVLAALAHQPDEAARALPPGTDTSAPAVQVALAAVAAHRRRAGWETLLAKAGAVATQAGRPLDAWWAGWLLTEALIADGRLADARTAADAGAARSAEAGAYSWETRFLAAGLWTSALLGDALDTVVRRAVDLLDRTLPPQARRYALAAACLALADTGALAAARTRLDGRGPADTILDWVDAEVAWLDNQAGKATGPGNGTSLAGGLHAVTARWAAHDAGAPVPADPAAHHPVAAVDATLAAWRTGRPPAFTAAANEWAGTALREQIRCLLAAGLAAQTADDGLPALLRAEQAAEDAGLVVLRGRVHRALRRFAVRRENTSRGGVTTLTSRERQILELVAAGEPTRRIAGILGLSRDTVETHVRSAMRRLGARTRTEAAAQLGAAP